MKLFFLTYVVIHLSLCSKFTSEKRFCELTIIRTNREGALNVLTSRILISKKMKIFFVNLDEFGFQSSTLPDFRNLIDFSKVKYCPTSFDSLLKRKNQTSCVLFSYNTYFMLSPFPLYVLSSKYQSFGFHFIMTCSIWQKMLTPIYFPTQKSHKKNS